MCWSQGYQTNLVGMIQDQNIFSLLPILVQTVQFGVVSAGHTPVILGICGSDAVLDVRNGFHNFHIAAADRLSHCRKEEGKYRNSKQLI